MPLTEQLAASLQSSLTGGRFWLAALLALAAGLTTAFTPCVYPLIPINVRYFGAMQGVGRGTLVSRVVSYILGLVLLYATLGTVFAMSGRVFGTFLASRWVLLALAVLCAAMGLSILGLFTLQLPSRLSTSLARAGGRGLAGAFVMGLVSSLIAAPCTGPALLVILTLVAKAGQLALGFSLMTAFALGLGIPFFALALFSGALSRVPAGGAWMELVKVVLAAAMLVVAFYFLELAWPGLGGTLAAVPGGDWVAAVVGLAAIALAVVYLSRHRATYAGTLKAMAVALLTFGGGIVVAGGSSGSDIDWVRVHDTGVAQARSLGRPVMIDFTADWCQACKELERETYVDPRVRAEARRFVAIRLDATQVDDAMNQLFARYDVLGLPTVVFIDSKGTVLSQPRVTGFVPPERFVAMMAQVH